MHKWERLTLNYFCCRWSFYSQITHTHTHTKSVLLSIKRSIPRKATIQFHYVNDLSLSCLCSKTSINGSTRLSSVIVPLHSAHDASAATASRRITAPGRGFGCNADCIVCIQQWSYKALQEFLIFSFFFKFAFQCCSSSWIIYELSSSSSEELTSTFRQIGAIIPVRVVKGERRAKKDTQNMKYKIQFSSIFVEKCWKRSHIHIIGK